MGEMISGLKEQGKAILIMVGIAIISVLGMIILENFRAIPPPSTGPNLTGVNGTIQIALTAFIAGFAIVGTFATVTMLIIVVKAIIGVVKGLQ